MIRTHDAGALRAEHVGQTVTLAGWVARRRDHGGVAFLDLREASGVVQVVVRDEAVAHSLRSEYCLKVTGEVVAREGAETAEEGCLSLPGITDKVERPTLVTIKAQDLEGKPIEILAEDWLARAFCHEIDHLDGVLFTDYLRGLRKERVKRQLRKLAAEQEVTA